MSKKPDRAVQRELAKIGMTTALGVAVLTAPFLKRNRPLKNIHTGAGLALVALGLWHHLLYQPGKRTIKQTASAIANANRSEANAQPKPEVVPSS